MTLDQRLLVAARRFRDRPAINVAGVRVSYEQLLLSARDISEDLRLAGIRPGQLVALCAERTFAAYASVLGILLAGCGYVPLNVTFPASRNRQILSSSQAVALVVDETVQVELEKHVGVAPLTLPILKAMPVPRSGTPGAELDDFKSLGALAGQTVTYLLFTSGTTGVPKGVPINAGNLEAYIDAVHELMPIDSSDRLLQAVDLTFDLSVHDMMMCWLHGAELFVAPQNGAILAPRTIRANNLTACLLVPSAAAKSAEFGLIAPDAMPSLKYSLFAGEAFPVSLSRKWQAAAPNATIFNMYGPTEGTIHTSYYRVDPENYFDGAVTPIGWPIENNAFRLEAKMAPRSLMARPVRSGSAGRK
ncbi:AMP-binding protein [Rhizobium sp. BR 314]|uniref:AMP-binding protein n=1 Tax=Rhizobium sp. BR 314 TaxID=3040013 RepID=UPI0039BF28C0